MDLMESPIASVRVNAISSINPFIRVDCHEFHAHLNRFVDALSQRANTDTNAEVQKCICKSLVYLMESFKNQIAGSLPYIYQYVLRATQSQDLSVSLEACEFWLAASEMEDLLPGIVTFYSR